MPFQYTNLISQNLVIREWLNGSVAPLSMNLTFIIGIFLWQSYWEARERGVRWRSMAGVATGCALWWLFLAESIRAFFVWIILRQENLGQPLPRSLEIISDFGFMIAAGMLIAMMLRAAYIFTPPKWGHAFWIYSALSTMAILALSHFFK